MFAERLKEQRENSGLSMDQLAFKIGCSKNFIYFLEQGLKEPSAKILQRIADVFNCTTDYLLGR